MPNKLNDTQIAELIMKHTNGTSISALAKEYEIARDTARRYITNNADLRQDLANIKNDTITAWLKAHTSQIQGLLDLCIDLLPDKLKEASAREIVGAYKILTETSVNNVDNKPNSNGGNSEIKDEITIEIVDNSGDDADG